MLLLRAMKSEICTLIFTQHDLDMIFHYCVAAAISLFLLTSTVAPTKHTMKPSSALSHERSAMHFLAGISRAVPRGKR